MIAVPHVQHEQHDDLPTRWDRVRRMMETPAEYSAKNTDDADTKPAPQEKASTWFAKVPAAIIRDRRLTSGARDVLIALLLYADSEGTCYPRQSTIADDLGIARPEVSRRMKLLCQTGYLTMESGKSRGMQSIYHVHVVPLDVLDPEQDGSGAKNDKVYKNHTPASNADEGVYKNHTGVSDDVTGVYKNHTGGVRKTTHPNITDPYNRAIQQSQGTEEEDAHASFVSAPRSASPDDAKLPTKRRKSPVFEPESEPIQIALYLRDAILRHSPHSPNVKAVTAGSIKLQQWAIPLDLMLRIDERNPQEVRALIDFATTDEFWRANILSPGKFRERYDTLRLQMQRKRAAPRRPDAGADVGPSQTQTTTPDKTDPWATPRAPKQQTGASL